MFISFDDFNQGYFKPIVKFEDFEVNLDNYEDFVVVTNKWYMNMAFRYFKQTMISVAKRKIRTVLSQVITQAVNEAIYAGIPELI